MIMTDSRWCTTETNTTLQSSYIPIKEFKKRTAHDDKLSRAPRQRMWGAAWLEQSEEASQEATGPRPVPRDEEEPATQGA